MHFSCVTLYVYMSKLPRLVETRQGEGKLLQVHSIWSSMEAMRPSHCRQQNEAGRAREAPKRKRFKETRARLYIIRQCIYKLLCWHEHGDWSTTPPEPLIYITGITNAYTAHHLYICTSLLEKTQEFVSRVGLFIRPHKLKVHKVSSACCNLAKF